MTRSCPAIFIHPGDVLDVDGTPAAVAEVLTLEDRDHMGRLRNRTLRGFRLDDGREVAATAAQLVVLHRPTNERNTP